MLKDFYASKEYRIKQSLLTKQNWQKGVFNFLLKKEIGITLMALFSLALV